MGMVGSRVLQDWVEEMVMRETGERGICQYESMGVQRKEGGNQRMISYRLTTAPHLVPPDASLAHGIPKKG